MRSGARKRINEQTKTGMTSEPSGPAAPLTRKLRLCNFWKRECAVNSPDFGWSFKSSQKFEDFQDLEFKKIKKDITSSVTQRLIHSVETKGKNKTGQIGWRGEDGTGSRAGRCEKQELKNGMQSVFKEKQTEGAGGSLKGPSVWTRAVPPTPAATNNHRTEEAKQVVLKRKSSSVGRLYSLSWEGGGTTHSFCLCPPPEERGPLTFINLLSKL